MAAFQIQLLVVLAMLPLPSVLAVVQSATLSCLKESGGAYIMRMFIRKHDDTIGLVHALDAVNTEVPQCGTYIHGGNPKYITGDGTDADPFFIEVKYSDAGITAVSTTECGVEKVSTTVFKWRFLTRVGTSTTLNHIVLGTDVEFLAECDFATGAQSLELVAAVDVTGDISRTVNPTAENVGMAVYDVAGNDVAQIVFGAQMGLKIALTPADGATGVMGFDCKACDNAICSNYVYPIIRADGCLDAVHWGAAGDHGFTSGTGVIIRTGFFNSFRFSGANHMVHYVCDVEFCYGADLAKCKNLCAVNLAGRKRRAVPKNETQSVHVTLVIQDIGHGDPASGTAKLATSEQGSISPQSTMFIATVAPLCVVVVMLLTTSVLLVIKLRHGRQILEKQQLN